MWAQLIKMDVKPEHVADLPTLFGHLQQAEQPDSGLLRTSVFQDRSDPTQAFVVVLFESEAKARIREQDPRRKEALKSVQEFMTDVLAGPPSFVDLDVIQDVTT